MLVITLAIVALAAFVLGLVTGMAVAQRRAAAEKPIVTAARDEAPARMAAPEKAVPATAPPADDETAQRMRKRHAKLAEDALASLKSGDQDEAAFTLELAQQLKLADPDALAREKAVAEAIAQAKARREFESTLKAIDALIIKGDAQGLKDALERLKRATERAPDAAAKEDLERRERKVLADLAALDKKP
jgi:hypothetical protein